MQKLEIPPQKPKVPPIDVSRCVRQLCQLDQCPIRRLDSSSVIPFAVSKEGSCWTVTEKRDRALRPAGRTFHSWIQRFIANRRFARLLLGRRDGRPGPARPCHFVTHLSRSHGWGTWRLNDDLKLGESTFLNTLSRLAKVPASEEIARYPNWKTPFCHALSRTCHAPVTPLS